MKTKNKSNLIKILIIAIFFAAGPVFASEFSLKTLTNNISVGTHLKVNLLLDTKGVKINAVEGQIYFDQDKLDLKEIRINDSVINLWMENPKIENGKIIFAGITPGGYAGNEGNILSIIFSPKKEGLITISTKNLKALINDGAGTEDKISIKNLVLKIVKEGVQDNVENINITDNESPDTFKPEIGRSGDMFDNKWFVVFIAQDKGTGVDRYEIRESMYNIFNFSKWITAESPYILVDQELKSNVYVKAIDKSGNTKIVKLSPQNPISWYANIEIWFIIVLVIFVAFTYSYLYKKLRHENI